MTAPWPRFCPDCPPRYATPRRPDRATYGPVVRLLAEELGRPLLWWQTLVADVALEVDPATGRLAYREVVILTPRQSGKTTLTLPVMTHRGLAFGGQQRIGFTMQTRTLARQHWEDEQLPVLDASPLAGLFRTRKRLNAEAVLWRPTASIQMLLSPTERGGHSKTLDLAVLDEGWALDVAVEQAVSPTMITRPEPQLWVPSTAGTLRSQWLRGKVDAGRARVLSGIPSTSAYFEWSAPVGADPADPATWWACMPALGRTVTEAAVQAEFDKMDLDDFCRAYLNWWPDERPHEEWAALSEQAWTDQSDPAGVMRDPVALAVDVSVDRKWASLSTAGARADGRRQFEVVDHRPGTAWVPGRAAELVERHEVLGGERGAVVVDGGGPAASLIPALAAAGVETHVIGSAEVARACGAFRDDLNAGAIVHLGQEPMTTAAAGARTRPCGDGEAWARRGADVVITPLVAAGHALWGYAVLPRREEFGWTAY